MIDLVQLEYVSFSTIVAHVTCSVISEWSHFRESIWGGSHLLCHMDFVSPQSPSTFLQITGSSITYVTLLGEFHWLLWLRAVDLTAFHFLVRMKWKSEWHFFYSNVSHLTIWNYGMSFVRSIFRIKTVRLWEWNVSAIIIILTIKSSCAHHRPCRLSRIMVWIINYTQHLLWAVITHLCPKFISGLAKSLLNLWYEWVNTCHSFLRM